MERNDKKFITDRYFEVKNLGWVISHRPNNTGIGKTFEDYVGVVENNLAEPDLAGYEIKSHRSESTSYVTLFTSAPNFPKKANTILRDKYGTPLAENEELLILHTSMFANRYNTYKGNLSFRLKNDRVNRKLLIEVYDNNHNLLDSSVGYTYESLESKLRDKLKKLFYVSAERRYVDGHEEFYFNHAEIYTEPSLSKFLDLVDRGLIMYDIRIGSYKSGRMYGKAHDHGSGFRILEQNIHLLYENREVID